MEEIRLNNGTTVNKVIVKSTMAILRSIYARGNNGLLVELCEKAEQGDHYTMLFGTSEQAEQYRLIETGIMAEDVKNIILSAVSINDNSDEIKVNSPVSEQIVERKSDAVVGSQQPSKKMSLPPTPDDVDIAPSRKKQTTLETHSPRTGAVSDDIKNPTHQPSEVVQKNKHLFSFSHLFKHFISKVKERTSSFRP